MAKHISIFDMLRIISKDTTFEKKYQVIMKLFKIISFALWFYKLILKWT